ncbi:MAG: penicillin-binding protein 2 [Planctomycetota bacterium]|nr:MAG: penicillin-binding protein 2 [Planctomycetota bacterium]
MHRSREHRVLQRANIFLAMVAIFFLLLGFRLFYLQILQHRKYKALAYRQQFRKIPLFPHRGDILSSDQKLLARSIEINSLFAVPKDISDKKKLIYQLSKYLPFTNDQKERLLQRLQDYRYRNFAWIWRRLDDRTYQKIKALHLAGIGFEKEFRRYYPNGRLACHVLGATDIDGNGLEGIEKVFDRELKGKMGFRVVGIDALGRHLREDFHQTILPRDGKSVQLTIDSIIQSKVERELQHLAARWKPRGACAVVLSVKDSQVLALASWPSFDPNHIQDSEKEALRNRAIVDYYEPGSTLKPFVALSAVLEGVMQFEDAIFCHNGTFRFGPRTIRDTHPYEWLSLSEAIVKSSNIALSQVGVRLGDKKLREYIQSFGFGKKTGIELPGEEEGKLTSMEKWGFYTTTSVSMGYEIGVTCLQLANAYAAMVNGGYLHRPILVKRVYKNSKVVYEARPRLIRRVYQRPELTKKILLILESVVEEGTAKLAKISDYRLGGKTGTARRASRKRRGYSGKYLASFVAVAPISSPEIVVAVMVDSPTGAIYGGVVAAPSAAKIAHSTLAYLGVQPDKILSTQTHSN